MKLRKPVSTMFLVLGSMLLLTGSVSSTTSTIPGTDFEDGSLSSWDIGSQSGSLTGGVISQNGTGVTLISGPVTFNAPAHGSVGSPTLSDGSPNPYYQPAVSPAAWSFSPFGDKAVALQPNGQSTFDQATSALGLSSADNLELKSIMATQSTASGYGSGNPTDAAWITKDVELTAGVIYTMSWNYIGTDYVPFNDGSITTLTTTSATANASTTVNNQAGNYALLGFTNPGTGDYSTGTYGSTGWQVSTYQVSETGTYKLGFAVFNLDDTGLSPVLLVDNNPGSTTKNGEAFGAVAPNNPDAPTVAPTTSDAPTTTEAPTTSSAPTTSAAPPVTEAPATPIYVPPVFEETTTTLVPETSAPTTSASTPPEEIPSSSPVILPPELPKTGNGSSSIALLGLALLILGLGTVVLGKEIRND
jgi:fibronectin-binding autotransporter adhesin